MLNTAFAESTVVWYCYNKTDRRYEAWVFTPGCTNGQQELASVSYNNVTELLAPLREKYPNANFRMVR
jgi:hypothetical protein